MVIVPLFDSWVESVMQHPVCEPSWWWNKDAVRPLDPSRAPAVALDFLTRLFETPSVFAPYTNEEVAQGLWFLLDSSCSDYMSLFRRRELSVALRVRGVESIVKLNEELFADRCPPDMHGAGEHSLGVACYMLWDLSEALEPSPQDPPIDEACLKSLTKILGIRHPVCQKSALHGLGHWAKEYPDRVQQIIGDYLGSQAAYSELRSFALAAQFGQVP
jgi:hypothetical protein